MTFALAITFPSLGAEFRAGEEAEVKSDETVGDDLYLFGDEVLIDGTVQGDVVAFGRIVTVNGTVEGDLVAAGQAIVINGAVADDVRIAGQVFRIDQQAEIGDDVIAAGFSMEFTDDCSVDGDFIYAGYQALMNGDTKGVFNAALVNCEINGHIGGDVELAVSVDAAGPQAYTSGQPPPISMPTVPPGLTIGDSAQIDGDLDYSSPREAEIDDGAQIVGEVQHTRPPEKVIQPPTPAEKAMRVVRQYASLLLIGLVVVAIAPTWSRRLTDHMAARPVMCLGLGVGGMVGFVVLLPLLLAAMIAAAVIAGLLNFDGLIPVAIVLGLTAIGTTVVAFWFYTSYLATILFSYFAGSRLLGAIQPALGENRFVSLIVGIILLAFIATIPYLGAILGWLIILLALGALVGKLFWRSKTPQPESA